ncbi:MAG TPA: LPS export ABC transporter periplasmic protein LptC [Paludibaculum sp.]|jgi:lipopolysaccharide export system protein LptA
MLRRARWLILLAILGIAATVGFIFIARKRAIRKARPTISAPLPVNTSATASQWEFEIKSGDKAKIRVRARKFEQIKDPSTFLFEGMEMEIRSVDKPKYHLVKSERASFDQDGGQMYSDGEVEITMNLSQETGRPIGRLMKIHTSGATLDVKTSRVSTDRKATFEFNEGRGECVGAMYDPSTRELFMRSEVRIDWRGKDEKKPPMHLETGALIYKELSSQILLSPTASLRRGGFTLDSGPSVVLLKKGQIDRVEAKQGHGTDVQPGRQVEYSADQLNLMFTAKAEISKIEASENAKLVSTSAAGRTTATANRFDLDFDITDEGSVLKRALATTKARVESQAAARPGAAPQGARILTSEVIDMTMRAGGKEMEKVVTHAPGQVEFLPGKKGDKRRQLNGERITIDYGAGNMIEKFRAVGVTTRAESDPKDAKKDPKPVITVTKSKDLEAFFDPQTGQMTRMEQWNNFEYEEGTRRATADRAVLDSTKELITLETRARMWDETGSTSADKIVMEQQSGDMVALGHVSSTRMPDKKQSSDGMLSASEPLQAKADRMAATEKNQKIRYEGNAMLWQSASSLKAKTIVIDRTTQVLEATGEVVNQLPDQTSDETKKKRNAFTIVKAQSLMYTDKTQMAHYTGGTTLDRQGLNVRAAEMRAWFVKEPKKGGGEETKLDRMFSDGDVKIAERSPERTRDGSAEHSEYYLADERMVMNGGNPVVTDSKRGTSRGAEIVWYSRQDKLTVDNSGSGPAVSRIKKKK